MKTELNTDNIKKHWLFGKRWYIRKIEKQIKKIEKKSEWKIDKSTFHIDYEKEWNEKLKNKDCWGTSLTQEEDKGDLNNEKN